MSAEFYSRRKAVEVLRELSSKVQGEEWFVQHAATDDGLSRIDDGLQHGMHPIYGEAHDIEFAAACVNFVLGYVVPLTSQEIDEKAWRDAGERERLRADARAPGTAARSAETSGLGPKGNGPLGAAEAPK